MRATASWADAAGAARANTKTQVDAAIKCDRLKPNEAMKLLANYEKALKGYTYLSFNGNGNGAGK